MKLTFGFFGVVAIACLVGGAVAVFADVIPVEICAPVEVVDEDEQGFCPTQLVGSKCESTAPCNGLREVAGKGCKLDPATGTIEGVCIKCTGRNESGPMCRNAAARDMCTVNDGYGLPFGNWIDCGIMENKTCTLDPTSPTGAKCSDVLSPSTSTNYCSKVTTCTP